MAIDKQGGAILHSIYGKQLGVDSAGHIAGVSGVRAAYEESTAASTLTSYGVSILSGSTASHTLGPPAAVGITKTIVNASSLSTATMTITRNAATHSFLGSTGGDADGAAFNLLNAGSAVSFIGISTTQWAPIVSKASSLYYTISTSS